MGRIPQYDTTWIYQTKKRIGRRICTIYEVKMENSLRSSILLPAEDLLSDLRILIHLLPFLAINHFRPRKLRVHVPPAR